MLNAKTTPCSGAPRDAAGTRFHPASVSQAGALSTRIVAALCLLTALGVLALAAWLKPDPRGYGTHQQLGLAPCGMLIMTGYPCPTCGMTTAFAHTVRGQWLSALWVQPSGFLLALATIGSALASAAALVTGRNPLSRVILWLTPYRAFAALLVVLVGGWGFRCLIVAIGRANQ